MNYQQVDKISDKNWLSHPQQTAIIGIIEHAFKGVEATAYFAKYFTGNNAYKRCVRLFYQDDILVGYCLLTFSYGENKSIIMGASAAFLSSYRGSNSTFLFSFWWALKTYLSRPSFTVYYLDTMLSPAMYRAMGKKLALIYPNPDMSHKNRDEYTSLVPDAELSPWRNLPCLHYVGRATNYSADELVSLKTSNKAEIAFYCTLNPQFELGNALLVLIPINFKQFALTGIKWVKSRFNFLNV